MVEDGWMHGKPAASPRSGATWASENAARRQRDRADAKVPRHRDTRVAGMERAYPEAERLAPVEGISGARPPRPLAMARGPRRGADRARGERPGRALRRPPSPLAGPGRAARPP